MSLVKNRHFEMKASETTSFEACQQQLLQQPGIYEVTLDSNSNRLDIRYDLEKINMARIEDILQHTGVNLSQSFWARLKRNWSHYTEENELENHRAPAMPCCSHPDELLAQKKHH